MWVVGMMGTGKTTAGHIAAAELGVPFHDTDEVVTARMGCSIAQFWGEHGEAAFREIEKVATTALAIRDGIRAGGGGVILDPDNRDVIRRAGKVVWLKADPEVLAVRLEEHDERPLVALVAPPVVETLADMLKRRTPLYEAVATHEVETGDLGVDDVAGRLESIWLS